MKVLTECIHISYTSKPPNCHCTSCQEDRSSTKATARSETGTLPASLIPGLLGHVSICFSILIARTRERHPNLHKAQFQYIRWSNSTAISQRTCTFLFAVHIYCSDLLCLPLECAVNKRSTAYYLRANLMLGQQVASVCYFFGLARLHWK